MDQQQDESPFGRVSSLIVTTSRPPAVATSTTGGSITLLCPNTGAVQSTCRIQGGDLQNSSSKHQLGVNSLSFFPLASHDTTRVALAYGTENNNAFAILISVRRSSAPPIPHWRCRVPEPMSAFLLVSPLTSRHVIGGGTSGALYVWDACQDGALLRTIPHAHYQAITCMAWSSSSSCELVTGGADGMVHVFSHQHLVEATQTTVAAPLRTWTQHQLAVTCLVALDGGRMVSTGEDGQVVVMDISSGAVVLTIQVEHALQTLAACGGRVYAGSVQGAIHCIDLDQYAMERSVARHKTVAGGSVLDQVLGPDRRQSILHGHDRAITALAILDEDTLASGDAGGSVRIWEQGVCVRVTQPWTTATNNPTLHPVTSILPVLDEEESPFKATTALENNSTLSMLETARKGTSGTGFVSLLSPLQKYASTEGASVMAVPFLQHQPIVDDDDEDLGNYEDLFSAMKRRKVESLDTKGKTVGA